MRAGQGGSNSGGVGGYRNIAGNYQQVLQGAAGQGPTAGVKKWEALS